jgi:hypothetical protein
MPVSGGLNVKAIKATWKNGQVLLDSAADWPEGRRLIVSEADPTDLEFLTEKEQPEDAAAVEAWIDEVRALPGLAMTPEQEAAMIAWRQKAREFNLQAVRRQMEEGIL